MTQPSIQYWWNSEYSLCNSPPSVFNLIDAQAIDPASRGDQ